MTTSRLKLRDDFDYLEQDQQHPASTAPATTHAVSHRSGGGVGGGSGRPGSAGVQRSHTIGPAPMAERMYREMAAAANAAGSSSAAADGGSSSVMIDSANNSPSQQQLGRQGSAPRSRSNSSGATIEIAPLNLAGLGGEPPTHEATSTPDRTGVPPLFQPPRSARGANPTAFPTAPSHQQQQQHVDEHGSSRMHETKPRAHATSELVSNGGMYVRHSDPRPHGGRSSSASSRPQSAGGHSNNGDGRGTPAAASSSSAAAASQHQRHVDAEIGAFQRTMDVLTALSNFPVHIPSGAGSAKRPLSARGGAITSSGGGGFYSGRSASAGAAPASARNNSNSYSYGAAQHQQHQRHHFVAAQEYDEGTAFGFDATYPRTSPAAAAAPSHHNVYHQQLQRQNHGAPPPPVMSSAAGTNAFRRPANKRPSVSAAAGLDMSNTSSSSANHPSNYSHHQHLQQQQHFSVAAPAPSALFLEQTQAELERVSSEKHELQRAVVELQQEKAALLAENEMAAQQLEASRAQEAETAAALLDAQRQLEEALSAHQELDAQLQDAVASAEHGRILLEEQQQQQQQQQQQYEEQSHHQHQSSTTIVDAAVEKAVAKALFVLEGNFDASLIDSLRGGGSDNDSGSGSAAGGVDVAELINFLADRVVELLASSVQLAAHAETAAEMEQLAAEWDEHEAEMQWQLQDLEAHLAAERTRSAHLQRQIDAMEEAVAESTLSNAASPRVNAAASTTTAVVVVVDDKVERQLKKQLMEVADSLYSVVQPPPPAAAANRGSSNSNMAMLDKLVAEAEGGVAQVREALASERNKLADAKQQAVTAAAAPLSAAPTASSSSPSTKKCRWSDVPVVVPVDASAAAPNGGRSRPRFTSVDLARVDFDVASLVSPSFSDSDVFVHVCTAIAASWGIVPPAAGFFCTAPPRHHGSSGTDSFCALFAAEDLRAVLTAIARSYDAARAPFHNAIHAANACQSLFAMLAQQDDECCNLPAAVVEKQERARAEREAKRKSSGSGAPPSRFDDSADGDSAGGPEPDLDIYPNPAASLLRNMDFVERLALLLSAAACCIAHPGRSGEHLARVRDPVALRYGNRNVLPQFHAATLLQLLLANDDAEQTSSGAGEAKAKPHPLLSRLDEDDVDRLQRVCLALMLGVNGGGQPSATPHAFAESLWYAVDSSFGVDDELTAAESTPTRTKILAWLLHTSQYCFAVRGMLGSTASSSSSSPTTDAARSGGGGGGNVSAAAIAAFNASVAPWLARLTQECEQQREAETRLGFHALSTDVAVRVSSEDATQRSIVWLYDGVVLPAMALTDALIHPAVMHPYLPAIVAESRKVALLADAAAAARNAFAAQAKLPTVEPRELKAQCRAMARVVAANASPERRRAAVEKLPPPQPQQKSVADAATANRSMSVSEADVEAMRWSFAEVQRSLLETIAEYQAALEREMEEKRLLMEATAQIVHCATPHLAAQQGAVRRSAEL